MSFGRRADPDRSSRNAGNSGTTVSLKMSKEKVRSAARKHLTSGNKRSTLAAHFNPLIV